MALLRKQTLPGFGLALGYTTLYLGLIVLLPLAVLIAKSVGAGWDAFRLATTTPRAFASYRLTFGAAAIAAAINSLFGLIIAWVLARYDFRGRRIVDAAIDLPFALPTAVAGITLATLYGPKGWFGAPLLRAGLRVSYTPLGVIVALTFVGLPFVVRSVQPVLQETSREAEEAAETLGASPWQTFRRVVFPHLLPALLTGGALAFARGIGEYGSVVFIAGNMPMKSEVTSLLIMTQLEQFDYGGANALAAVMLAISFALLFAINALQRWSAERGKRVRA